MPLFVVPEHANINHFNGPWTLQSQIKHQGRASRWRLFHQVWDLTKLNQLLGYLFSLINHKPQWRTEIASVAFASALTASGNCCRCCWCCYHCGNARRNRRRGWKCEPNCLHFPKLQVGYVLLICRIRSPDDISPRKFCIRENNQTGAASQRSRHQEEALKFWANASPLFGTQYILSNLEVIF